jgi:hypothetical protein
MLECVDQIFASVAHFGEMSGSTPKSCRVSYCISSQLKKSYAKNLQCVTNFKYLFENRWLQGQGREMQLDLIFNPWLCSHAYYFS